MLTIEWQSVTSGEVRYCDLKVASEDEEKQGGDEFVGSDGLVQSGTPQLLFTFDFTNRTNGYLFAKGDFLGIKGKYVGTYSFFFPSPVGLVFTLHTKSGEIITISGSKLVVQREPSFFQKMLSSPMLLIAGFMLFRMYLSRGRQDPTDITAGGNAREGEAARTGGGSAGGSSTRNSGRGRSTPSVEDVTDKKKD